MRKEGEMQSRLFIGTLIAVLPHLLGGRQTQNEKRDQADQQERGASTCNSTLIFLLKYVTASTYIAELRLS